MTAAVVQIADSLVAALNGHSFSKPFTAVRAYLPTYKLEDMGTLHVTVVPATFDGEAADRTRERESHVLHVAVQQRFNPDNGTVRIAFAQRACGPLRGVTRLSPHAAPGGCTTQEDGEQTDLRSESLEGIRAVHEPSGLHLRHGAVMDNVARIKRVFLDRRAVIERIGRANAATLAKAGAFHSPHGEGENSLR